MNEIELFWERVNSLIKKLNTTQNEVSVRCKLNPRRLQNLSAGNRLPDCFEAVSIAKVLNTTVEYLVTGKSINPYEQKYNELKESITNLYKEIQ